MRLIALILMLVVPTWAVAQKFDPKATLNDIGPLYIELMDNATNGCWTNIMETKNYAAGQIDIAGGKVVETPQEAYSVFGILVSAARMDDGRCYGNAQVSIYRPAYHEGVSSLVMFSQFARQGVQLNFNNLILDVIKEAVGEWR